MNERYVGFVLADASGIGAMQVGEMPIDAGDGRPVFTSLTNYVAVTAMKSNGRLPGNAHSGVFGQVCTYGCGDPHPVSTMGVQKSSQCSENSEIAQIHQFSHAPT